MYFIFHLPKLRIKWDKTFTIFVLLNFIYLCFEILQAVFRNVEILSALRFFEILFMIPLCSLLREDEFTQFFHITVIFAVLKCLMLIGIGIYLLKIGSYTVIRNWIFSISGGDIYIANGFPKIQVQGNGIIPLIFILYCSKKNRIDLIAILLLLGILFAGNFAFYLAVLCFFFLIFIKIIKKDSKLYKTPLLLIVLLFISPILLKYVEKKVEEKSVYSNAVRIEQAEVLLDTNWFVGKGLGNKVQGGGRYRVYNGEKYFELQTLYIFNQIGAVGLIFFYLITIFGIHNVQYQKKRILLYFIYFFYTFWNPYCFDTTQMLTIVLLINTDLNPHLSRKFCRLKTKKKLLKYLVE